MDDLVKWSQSPAGQLVGTVIIAVLGAIVSKLVEKLLEVWPTVNKAKYTIGGLLVLSIVSISFWFFYPELAIVKITTLGLASLVLIKSYRTAVALQRKVDEQEKTIKEQSRRTAGQQIGKIYDVSTRGANHVEVRSLKRMGLPSGRHLDITWGTVLQGAEYLSKQIARYKGGCRPNLILGINELGTVLASYLNGKLWRGEKEIGIVRSGPPDQKSKKRPMFYSIPDIFVKDKSKELSVLLVDSEIKSGESTRQIIDELQNSHTIKQIYLAVLTACRVANPTLQDMAEIMYKKDDRTPARSIAVSIDFLAFFTSGDVEPPDELR